MSHYHRLGISIPILTIVCFLFCIIRPRKTFVKILTVLQNDGRVEKIRYRKSIDSFIDLSQRRKRKRISRELPLPKTRRDGSPDINNQ